MKFTDNLYHFANTLNSTGISCKVAKYRVFSSPYFSKYRKTWTRKNFICGHFHIDRNSETGLLEFHVFQRCALYRSISWSLKICVEIKNTDGMPEGLHDQLWTKSYLKQSIIGYIPKVDFTVCIKWSIFSSDSFS